MCFYSDVVALHWEVAQLEGRSSRFLLGKCAGCFLEIFDISLRLLV